MRKNSRRKPKKERLNIGDNVSCVFDLKCLHGTVEEVLEQTVVCKMIDQHIAADKTPFLITLPKNRVRNRK